MSRLGDDELGVHFDENLAYWGPLLQLLVFGLGWRRPDLGLERWHDLGQPTDDPILAVVNRWWGRHMPDVLAWAGNSPAFATAGQGLHVDHGGPGSGKVDRKYLLARREDPRWKRVWAGGSDPMHLVSHAMAPSQPEPEASSCLLKGPDESARAALVCDTYNGWHRALATCGLTQTQRGASWRVDVVVKPLGWLGTYRLSRETGAWFSGQHRWHQLGW
jgi:hypothetical protein